MTMWLWARVPEASATHLWRAGAARGSHSTTPRTGLEAERALTAGSRHQSRAVAVGAARGRATREGRAETRTLPTCARSPTLGFPGKVRGRGEGRLLDPPLGPPAAGSAAEAVRPGTQCWRAGTSAVTRAHGAGTARSRAPRGEGGSEEGHGGSGWTQGEGSGILERPGGNGPGREPGYRKSKSLCVPRNSSTFPGPWFQQFRNLVLG